MTESWNLLVRKLRGGRRALRMCVGDCDCLKRELAWRNRREDRSSKQSLAQCFPQMIVCARRCNLSWDFEILLDVGTNRGEAYSNTERSKEP